MLSRGAVAGALASVLLLTGCASPQQAAGAAAIGAGVAAGTYGAAITPNRCVAYDHDHRNNPQACVSTNPGHPEVGVPILIAAAALVVTGVVLIATDGHERPRHDPPMPPPEVVHRDESGYDMLK